MKKLFMVLFITLAISASGYAQSNISFGLNVGAAIPTGKLADAYETGFSIGTVFNINTSNPVVDVTVGVNYANLQGKSFSGYYYYGEYESADLISIFVGPKIGKESGLYFVPGIAANINEGDARIGLDFGGGFLIPMGSGKTKIDLCAKFCLLNLVGAEEGEDTYNIFRITAGLMF